MFVVFLCVFFFFFKQKTAYEMRISDWSSDVCSSDLAADGGRAAIAPYRCCIDHVLQRIPLEATEQPQAGDDALDLARRLAVRAAGHAVDIGAAIQADLLENKAVQVHDMEDRKSTRLNSSH